VIAEITIDQFDQCFDHRRFERLKMDLPQYFHVLAGLQGKQIIPALQVVFVYTEGAFVAPKSSPNAPGK
jgi:hypothetical protein